MVRIPEITPFIVYFRPPSANIMKQYWIPNGIIKVCNSIVINIIPIGKSTDYRLFYILLLCNRHSCLAQGKFFIIINHTLIRIATVLLHVAK